MLKIITNKRDYQFSPELATDTNSNVLGCKYLCTWGIFFLFFPIDFLNHSSLI